MYEVDTRTVEGTGATVSLVLVPAADAFSTAVGDPAVIVRDAAGVEVSRETYSDRIVALAHYRHTFAYADGPALPIEDDTRGVPCES